MINSFVKLTLLIILLLLPVIGCGKKSEPEYIAEAPKINRKSIKPTPTEVVKDYLSAIQSEDYSKAYKYVSAPYTDKAGYINQMKNTLAENDFSLISYRILATQIYDRTSTVVVELNTKLKSPNSGSLITLTQKSQYSLGIFEKKWLITSDNCIEGCIERESVIEVIE
jgi:hypothetical protein